MLHRLMLPSRFVPEESGPANLQYDKWSFFLCPPFRPDTGLSRRTPCSGCAIRTWLISWARGRPREMTTTQSVVLGAMGSAESSSGRSAIGIWLLLYFD